MSKNTTPSLLDAPQIAKRQFDDATDSVRTLITGSSGPITVIAGLLDVVDELDTPLTSAASINGSGGALVQVVASLAVAAKAVHLMDTGGRYLGLYLGAPSSEVLKMIINPGSDSVVDVSIPAGSRITLRSMETVGPSSGFIAINFLG
jgi:hypothetical protein